MSGGKKLEHLVINSKPVRCSECNGKMFYVGGGRYECETCGHIALDDFGKVKEFLEEHGPSPAVVISAATGVSQEVIDGFLKKGRVEIPEGSPYYLKCEKCGCSIRYGRFCADCAAQAVGKVKAIFNEEVGEKPKYELKSEKNGKIHFLNRKA